MLIVAGDFVNRAYKFFMCSIDTEQGRSIKVHKLSVFIKKLPRTNYMSGDLVLLGDDRMLHAAFFGRRPAASAASRAEFLAN